MERTELATGQYLLLGVCRSLAGVVVAREYDRVQIGIALLDSIDDVFE